MSDHDSLSLHPHVQMVVHGGVFLEAVKSYCILIKLSSTNVSDDDIRQVALTHSYPRIGLILATTKDKDGNPLLGGMGQDQDYYSQYQEVIRLITSPPYRDDIHRIAAQLTAAQVIKQVPLNTTLQFYTLGVQLEEQAIKDLERLCGYITPTKSSDYYRLAIYLHAQGGAINNNSQGQPYCWYYITTLDQNQDISSSEGLINLPYGDINQAIYKLVYELNEAFIDVGANLMISPNQIQISTDGPEGTKSVYSLNIASRLSSPKVSREMLTLRFLTCDQTTISNYQQDIITDYIDGLVYGVSPQAMTLKGPHSLIIDVREGQALGSKGAQGNSSNGEKASNKNPIIDTIYFKGQDLQGPLTYRVSNADMLGNTPYKSIQVRGDANQLALDFLQDLHITRWQNLVIGSLPYPNALRIVLANPLENNQLKVVIDILSLPQNLEIALGDELYRATPYEAGPRSITIQAVGLLGGASSSNQSLTVGGQAFGSAQVLNRRVSPRLQAVYDRLRQLEGGKGCYQDLG
jgi:hypothetical protein